MHSLAVLAFALAGNLCLVAGQSVDPSSVPLSTKTQWCHDQKSACPLLCSQLPGESQSTKSNDCDDTTLVYSCVCSNGKSPNASEYSQTIPYFECTEYNNQCVNNCGSGNSACASACREKHPCGAQNPRRVNLTTASASATKSAAATSTGSDAINTAGFAGMGGSSDQSGAASTSTALGQAYGLTFVLLGAFAGFSLLL